MKNIINYISAQEPPNTPATSTTPLNDSVKNIFSGYGGADANLNAVMEIINKSINILIDFSGIVALIMVFYATIIYVTSYGDDAKIETAKKTLTWAIIGLVVVAFSKLILYLIGKEVFNTELRIN